MLELNNKERMLLEDEKSHEQLCIEKYKEYSSKACDPVLKNLFSQLQQKEEQHLNSINQMLSGSVPVLPQQNQQNQQNQQSQQGNQNTQQSPVQSNNNLQSADDKYLCQDALSTEKYVSSTYNVSIFEMRDKNVRQMLNHIQKEEQEHGEQIYNYMSQHGMY